jgi:PhnB protein
MSVDRQAELEIRAIIEGWAKAVRTRNSQALASNFSSEVLVFDLIEPLQYSGRDAIAKRADQWLSSFTDPLD